MNSIRFFFTPIKYDKSEKGIKQYIFEGIEDYFYFYGKKACVIPGALVQGGRGVKLEEVPESKVKKMLLGAVKVASYFTIIIPFVMLALKGIFRASHHFHFSSMKESSAPVVPEGGMVPAESPGENRCNPFQEMVLNFFESEDEGGIEAFRERLLKEVPQIKKVMKVFSDNKQEKLDSDWINALYVLAGIKPVLVIEHGGEKETRMYLQILSECFPDLKLINPKKGHWYLINETPIDAFDPRVFIKDFDAAYGSVEAAVPKAFLNQNREKTDKLLSYFLGFGPAWEGYAAIGRRGRSSGYYSSDPEPSIYTDEHYFQLGKASLKDSEESVTREEYIKKGKAFSSNARKASYTKKNKEWPTCGVQRLEQEEIEKFYMYQLVDQVSFHTDYIQKGIAYRTKLLTLFGIPLNE